LRLGVTMKKYLCALCLWPGLAIAQSQPSSSSLPASQQNAQDLSTYCGNRVVERAIGETCDDGNKNSGDGCSMLCKTEPPPPEKFHFFPSLSAHEHIGVLPAALIGLGVVGVVVALSTASAERNPLGADDGSALLGVVSAGLIVGGVYLVYRASY
jgi:cysteine-rich repeat protein